MEVSFLSNPSTHWNDSSNIPTVWLYNFDRKSILTTFFDAIVLTPFFDDLFNDIFLTPFFDDLFNDIFWRHFLTPLFVTIFRWHSWWHFGSCGFLNIVVHIGSSDNLFLKLYYWQLIDDLVSITHPFSDWAIYPVFLEVWITLFQVPIIYRSNDSSIASW